MISPRGNPPLQLNYETRVLEIKNDCIALTFSAKALKEQQGNSQKKEVINIEISHNGNLIVLVIVVGVICLGLIALSIHLCCKLRSKKTGTVYLIIPFFYKSFTSIILADKVKEIARFFIRICSIGILG